MELLEGCSYSAAMNDSTAPYCLWNTLPQTVWYPRKALIVFSLAVRCSCVVDPYFMMCIVGWAGSSLVLVLFLSTVSSRHPEGEVGRYCPKRQCHMHILEGQRLLRCLEPKHPLTATKCLTLSACWRMRVFRRLGAVLISTVPTTCYNLYSRE